MSRLAYAALCAFVFCLPWERILVLPGVSVMPKLTGAIAAGLAVLAAVSGGRFRRFYPFHVIAFLFVLWTIFVVLILGGGPVLPNKLYTWPQLLLVVWIVWELSPTPARVHGLFLSYVAGAYVAVADTILIFRNQAGALKRFAAGGGDPNDLAMMLALAIPMSWYLGTVYHKPLVRWLCRAYLPIGVVAIGLTGSRGGVLATTVALMIIPLLMIRLSPGRLATAIVMVVLAGAAAIAYTPDTLIERFATTGAELEQGRIGGRGRLWLAGWHAFVQQPIMGYGSGTFRLAITPYVGSHVQTAHNAFISVAVEQGMVGLILYLAMIVTVYLSVRNLAIAQRRFAKVLLATMVVAMMPLTWEDRRAVWFVMAALTAFAHAGLPMMRARSAYEPASAPPPSRPPTPRLEQPAVPRGIGGLGMPRR